MTKAMTALTMAMTTTLFFHKHTVYKHARFQIAHILSTMLSTLKAFDLVGFYFFSFFPFLDASTHLYMRVCLSVRRSGGPLVRPLRVFFKLRKLSENKRIIEKAEIWIPDCE